MVLFKGKFDFIKEILKFIPTQRRAAAEGRRRRRAAEGREAAAAVLFLKFWIHWML